jgi:hypothetical protein
LIAARTMFETQPAFRAAIERCAIADMPAEGSDGSPGGTESLIDIIARGDVDGFRHRSSALEARARVALAYASAAMWQSWGVKPDAVLGERSADVAALVVAGAITIGEAFARLRGAAGRGSEVSVTAQMPIYAASQGGRSSTTHSASVADSAENVDAAAWTSALAAAAHDGYGLVIDMSMLEWNRVAAQLAEVFEQGVAVDWRGFDRGYGRSRIDVPASPWMRERFWFDEVVPREVSPIVARDSTSAAAPSPMPASAPKLETVGASAATAPIGVTMPAAKSPSTLRDRLAGLTAGERTEIVREIVQGHVMRVMRMRPDAPRPGMSDRLMSIGMDSLMAVELQKRLHRELEDSVALPSTLIFDHPTIASVADLVLRLLGLDGNVAKPAAVADALPSAAHAANTNIGVAAIADLTDEEVEALLAEQLKGFPK